MTSQEQHYKEIHKVCVVGLGYIGLPTATFIAKSGLEVIGLDINSATVEAVNSGKSPFFEPGFEELLSTVVSSGHLKATTTGTGADAFVIAVPTPLTKEKSVDTSYIEGAVETIAPLLKSGDLVVLESTSPPGTTEGVLQQILDLRTDLKDLHGTSLVNVAHCPERVIPGKIMTEIIQNDRVIGGATPNAAVQAKSLYRSFCEGDIILTDSRTAEMAKLAENSFRDVNIAFANELNKICDALDIDVWELISLANRHPRVDILTPGPGVGGHCIAVDPWFIVDADPDNSKLIKTARMINDSKPQYVVDQVLEKVKSISSPKLAVLGLAFKADIDDLRESPAIEITELLARNSGIGEILAVEPHVATLPTSLQHLPNVSKADFETAIAAADLILLLVDHKEFLGDKKEMLNGKNVIDTRGVLK